MTKAAHIMEKLAGFGWDLRAYNVDPAEFEAKFVNPRRKSGEWADKRDKYKGEYPNSRKLKYKMFGGKKRLKKAKEKWHARGEEFKAKNPNPVDTDKMYKWKRSKEVHKDFKTNYKLNNNMDFDTESGGGAGMLHGTKGSDFWNSNSPTVNFMTKDDLKTVVKNYKAKMKEYGPRQSTDRPTYKVRGKDGKLKSQTFSSGKENFDKGTKAFLSKADTILKDPKAKTILLEWE